MIRYRGSVDGITAEQLDGFFVDWGWPNPPTPATHLDILRNSDHVELALDDDTGNVVGYVTAVSDGILSAYIPLLEVLPTYQGQGVGTRLMQRILEQLSNLYIIDLTCDPHLQPFYERLGMRHATGMMVRNYARQSGE